MKTLFDLFSSGNCIGCNKVLKTYYNCSCYEQNNIMYSFPNLKFDIKNQTVLAKGIFYNKGKLVFYIIKIINLVLNFLPLKLTNMFLISQKKNTNLTKIFFYTLMMQLEKLITI